MFMWSGEEHIIVTAGDGVCFGHCLPSFRHTYVLRGTTW